MNSFENQKAKINHKISNKIILAMLLLVLVVIAIIGLSAKFLLPPYYYNYQIRQIETAHQQIKERYQSDNLEPSIAILESLQQTIGGEIYSFSPSPSSNHPNNPKTGSGYGNPQSQRFRPDGPITYYSYVNKLDLQMYVLGIAATNNSYLVYQVNIQELDHTIHIVIGYIGILLLITLVIAIIMAWALSTTISKPIKKLNQLAKQMKSKQIQAQLITSGKDEIGQLNHSLNELYEELLANIYQLESRLEKERNVEELKKKFLAQATHELKTPITIISGYCEILYDGLYQDETERDRYLKNIYQESRSIAQLINDVLDYTKMETGNYQLVLTKVNGQKFFSRLLERLQDYITAQQIRLDYQVDLSDAEPLTIDTTRIEQVVKNLISNALEHADTRISITIRNQGIKTQISVFNDGQPIADEDLPYLFDSFYKNKAKKTGTGLGLAIVKQIVILHKGYYRVENINHGTNQGVSVNLFI